MKSIGLIFCLILSAPAFARIDHHSLSSEQQTKLEAALEVIASFEETPTSKLWFNESIYRVSNEATNAGFLLGGGARLAGYLVNRYYSSVTGRVLETFRVGLKGAVAIGDGVLTASGVVLGVELVFSWIDGYHGFPISPSTSSVESLMGTPQGYQRVIAMAKDQTSRETLREFATKSEPFYDFLLSFGKAPAVAPKKM